MTRFLSRLKTTILVLLKQGLAPEKIALTIALGTVLSICPLPIVPTAVCAVVAIPLRLNIALIQIVNYLLLPAQWLLILPFIRLGERLFGADPAALTVRDAARLLRDRPLESLREFAASFMHGIGAWLVISPFVLAGLYYGLLPLLRVRARRERPSRDLGPRDG